MAHKYYNSASGGASSPYESAATAGTALATVLAAIGASDEIIWVDDASAEAAAGTTFNAPSTYSTPQKPQRLYGVSDFDASPSTLSSGAKLTQTAAGVDWVLEGNWDIKNFDFDLSTGTSVGFLALGTANDNCNISYESGVISLSASSTGGTGSPNIKLGPAAGSGTDGYAITLKNITVNVGHVNTVPFLVGCGKHDISGLTLAGAVPSALFISSGAVYAELVLMDSDLSAVSWSTLLSSSATGQIKITLLNCKIPSGITDYAGTSPFITVELIKTGNADIGYGYSKRVGGVGNIISDASVYATTDPMQDGGVSISNLFASDSTCGRGFPLSRTYIIPCVADTAVTPFVEILVQGDGAAALNTDEIYITASTVTVDGTTQGTTVTSHPGAITAGSACSAGTTAYTGDGYTTERTHRIETAAITPSQSGYIEIEVCLVKPSTAIYVGQVGAA